MQPYLFFYVEIEKEQYKSNEPCRIFYNLYSDGSYEKACVYDSDGELSHEMKTGILSMDSMLVLESFVKHEFKNYYCSKDALDHQYYVLATYAKNNVIIHETQGYLSSKVKHILSYLP